MQTVKPIYVLDACALLRLAQDEPGADLVAEILGAAQAGGCRVLMHQINLGEVVYRIGKGFGWTVAERKQAEISLLPIESVAFSNEIFWAAVKLKAHYPMSYADCFATALAMKEKAVLLTRRLSENRGLSQAVLKHPKKFNFFGCDFWDLPKNS